MLPRVTIDARQAHGAHSFPAEWALAAAGVTPSEHAKPVAMVPAVTVP